MGEKTKDRIALDLQPCCLKRSGVGTYALEIAARLRKTDRIAYHANYFNFCGRNDHSDIMEKLHMPVCEQKIVPLSLLEKFKPWYAWNYSGFFPSADITHFFGYTLPPRIRGKVVNTLYDMVVLRYPETMEKTNRKNIQEQLFSALDRTDYVVTISEFSKQEIVDLLGYPKEKIGIVYPAASIAPNSTDLSKTLLKYGIRQPYVLFVGSIEPRKNLERLVNAFAKLKKETPISHQLVLCGGKGWNNAEIFKIIEEKFAGDEVILTGYVSDEEKNALYQGAELFVFPSIYEGFGIPPLEAMYWNIPVLCSDIPVLREAAGNAAEYAPPDSIDKMAEGIYRLLSDPLRRQQLTELGKQQYQKYTWENSAQTLQKLYLGLL